jgi:hypothetical protein
VPGSHLGTATNFSPPLFDYFLDSFWFVDVGRPLWREVWSVLFSFCWASPAQPFPDLSPTGHMSIVYCLYFLDSPKPVRLPLSLPSKTWESVTAECSGWSGGLSEPVVFLEGAWGNRSECHQFHRPFSTLKNFCKLQGLILSVGGGSLSTASSRAWTLASTCRRARSSQSHITTDSQLARPSWRQAPIWDPRPILLSPWVFLLDSCGLIFCRVLSDERTGL